MMNFDIFGAARGKDFALRRSHFLDVVEDAFVPSRGRHIGRRRRLIWRVFVAPRVASALPEPLEQTRRR
jgi:hypothetical protein